MMSNVEIARGQVSGPNRLMIGGAGLLALLSASCCVLPIGLSIVGLGGAWLAILGPFVAYRVEILLLVGAVVAWGWFRVARRWDCASRQRSTVALLGLATAAFAVAASAPLWESAAARMMFALWREAQS
jgi:mercuric ion transport protein